MRLTSNPASYLKPPTILPLSLNLNLLRRIGLEKEGVCCCLSRMNYRYTLGSFCLDFPCGNRMHALKHIR